jgi:SPP1 family holin
MDRGTLIRTIVLALALINQFLIAAGLNPIPGTEEVWGEVISTIITFVAAAVAWFKNNYVTAKGKKQKEVLEKNGLN